MMKRPPGSLIGYFSNRAKKEGGINLAQGIPGFQPPPQLLEILTRISGDPAYQQYPPGNGNFNLLEMIRRCYSSITPLTQDNLLVVQGATEGIFLLFFYLTTIIEGPYSVLSFDPVYESYPRLAHMFKVPFVYVNYEQDLSVDFEKLEHVVEEERVKVIMVASPGNPLGKMWSEGEIGRLIELSEKHRFFIIFDGVYKDLYFGSPSYNPLSRINPRLLYVDSFSKMLSITGWRVGYIITEPNHMKKIRALHDYTGLCAPSLFQEAIARYLEEYEFGVHYVENLRKTAGTSYSFMKEKLESLGFTVPSVDGGYFLWAYLPPRFKDAFSFAVSLFESEGVAVVPGENFSKLKWNCIRVNIAAPLEIVREAAEKISRFIGSAQVLK